MRRIKLIVAYDGTDFCGWAAQPGQRAVQSTLTEAVRRVSGEEIEIIGASRTDSGAHAKGQVCHFDAQVGIEPAVWAKALNAVLPPDLAVVRSDRVGGDFNSRFCAIDRSYRYRILIGPRDPLLARFVHEYPRPLDLPKMQAASEFLVGTHDYRAFTEELDPGTENTVRKMNVVRVSRHGREIRIDIAGTAFLRGMMRRMSGALLEVGAGKPEPDEIESLLTEKRNDMHWPVVLPAKGLCLMGIRYGRHPKDHRTASDLA